MANWTARPDTDENRQAFKIHRCPATKPIRGVILSQALIGTYLHYWKGRSVPCSDNDCPACQAGQLARWKGYLQLLSKDSATVQIVEVTDRVWQTFHDAQQKHGSLRGLGVEIRRINGRPNGPLSAEIAGIQRSDAEIPREANLCEILERMWEQRQTALPTMEEESDPRGTVKWANAS